MWNDKGVWSGVHDDSRLLWLWVFCWWLMVHDVLSCFDLPTSDVWGFCSIQNTATSSLQLWEGVLHVIHLFDHIHLWNILFCLLKRGDMESLENFLSSLRLHHRISMIGWHTSQNGLLRRFCDRRPVPVPFFYFNPSLLWTRNNGLSNEVEKRHDFFYQQQALYC